MVICIRVVVAGRLEGTSAYKARAVIKGCIRIVVGVRGVRTSLFVSVTNVVVIGVFKAISSTHPNGIILVAIAITISLWDVRTSAFKDSPGSSADPTGINFGT